MRQKFLNLLFKWVEIYLKFHVDIWKILSDAERKVKIDRALETRKEKKRFCNTWIW